MKLINEKGRLFGVINIVDLAVLIIIILLAGVLGYRFLGDRISGKESAKKTILVTVKCPKATELAAQAIKPGDRIVAGAGYVNGVVKSVSYESAKESVVKSDGMTVVSEDPVFKDIYVVVEMHEDPADPILKLGNQEMRIGKDIFFKTQRVEILAVVYDIKVQQ